MSYELALAHLASLDESRIKPGLGRIESALSLLGAPHLQFPHILVGGTNGKGSVASFLVSALSRAGYRTGLYTSPHLIRFEERIAAGGVVLAQDQLTVLVEAVKGTGADLTYFEFATAMAMLHFAREKVDLAVLEVGIGGAWDATNAADPVLSVITSVDIDHQEWLGHAVEDIALEKAGIMRSGRAVVTGRLDKGAADAVLGHAGSVGARAILSGRDYTFSGDTAAHRLSFRGARWDIKDLVPGLRGKFQLENAACALAALEALAPAGFPVSRQDAAEGIVSAEWPGRFQVVEGAPPLIVDAAHNKAGVRALADSVGGRGPVVWLFSALSGKDVEGMASEMLRTSDRFVIVPMDHPRALTVDALAGQIPQSADVTKHSDVAKGLDDARRKAGASGCVVVAGSVVLAGVVLNLLGTRPFDQVQGPPSASSGR